jgi:hypothetical protein
MHPTFFAKCRSKIRMWLIPAGDLYGIVRDVYLNPLLACQLCLSWWQYLWRIGCAEDRGDPPAFRIEWGAQALRLPSAARILRGIAFSITLMLPADGWAQGIANSTNLVLPDAPSAQQSEAASPQATTSSKSPATFPQASTKPADTTADMLKKEEHQRILGVVPNFNTVDSADGMAKLSSRQKFHLAYKSTVDPFVFVADAFVAGVSQARNSNPGFGQGAQGYFKRFGASYLDTADGTLWGNAILPVLFKEDPRYFRMGHGSFKRRFLYSASTTVWCLRDNGKWGPSYANVLGNFISGGISNAYYPAADRGLGQTLDGALTVTAEGAIGAEFIEFWPDISRHLFKSHHAGATVKAGQPLNGLAR